MGRILALILGLAVVGYLGYLSVTGGLTGGGAGSASKGTPKERLDNVREAARRIEIEQQKAADEALKKAEPQE